MASIDRLLMPITIDSTNKVFRYIDSGGVNEVLITLTEGTYYLHDDSTLHATHKGLYYAIKTVNNSGTGADGTRTGAGTAVATMAFAAATPSSSSDQTGSGLEVSAATTFAVEFDDVGFTMDPRWFGETDSPWTSASSYTSTFMRYGDWTTPVWRGLRSASDRRSDLRNVTFASEDDEAYAYLVRWRANRRFRSLEYQWVPAAHVFDDRASDADYAETGRVSTGDDHNAWMTVWKEAARGRDVVGVYEMATQDLQVTTHDWEVWRLGAKYRDSFRSTLMDVRPNGEFYHVKFDVAVLPDYENYTF